jgi:hypothetical protein
LTRSEAISGPISVELVGDHRMYHFRLACSGFQQVQVILGGKRHVALSMTTFLDGDCAFGDQVS